MAGKITSQTHWKFKVIGDLSGPFRPRFLTIYDLKDIILNQRPGSSENTIRKAIDDFAEAGVLRSVAKGIYANMAAIPGPSIQELSAYFTPGAVVSLHTVLGDSGVANNLTTMVTSVVPVKEWPPENRKTERKTSMGVMRSYYMPEDKVHPPGLDSFEYLALGKSYEMARPEKAMLDYLYLSRNVRSHVSSLPLDMDIGGLDMKLLWKVANKMEVGDLLDAYLDEKNLYDSSDNVKANMNVTLGF